MSSSDNSSRAERRVETYADPYGVECANCGRSGLSTDEEFRCVRTGLSPDGDDAEWMCADCTPSIMDAIYGRRAARLHAEDRMGGAV